MKISAKFDLIIKQQKRWQLYTTWGKGRICLNSNPTRPIIMESFKEELSNAIFKDRPMRIIARLILLLVGIAILVDFVYYNVDGNRGKHAKFLFGLAER